MNAMAEEFEMITTSMNSMEEETISTSMSSMAEAKIDIITVSDGESYRGGNPVSSLITSSSAVSSVTTNGSAVSISSMITTENVQNTSQTLRTILQMRCLFEEFGARRLYVANYATTKHVKLSKVLERFCKSRDMNKNTVSMFFEGAKMDPDRTPNDYGLPNHAIIFVDDKSNWD